MISKRIKALRNSLKLSQNEISKALNVSPVTISRYENDAMSPSLEIIQRMVQVYSVNANWLITGEGDMYSSSASSPMNERESIGEPTIYPQGTDEVAEEVIDLRQDNQKLNEEIKELFRKIVRLQNELLEGRTKSNLSENETKEE